MPPSLTNNSTQPSIYSNSSIRFSGSGSPPIIDFTEWADNFRGQRFGFNLPNEFPPETPRTGPHSILHNSTELSPHGWRIDYAVLLSGLRPLMETQGNRRLDDLLNIEELATLHQRDRDRLSIRTRLGKEGSTSTIPCVDGVIGKPLFEVFLHGSLSLPIAGTEHWVPTIVVKCIEELYRTGLYQPQLFRRTPNFVRVEELIEVYDHRELSQFVRIARHRSQHGATTSDSAFGAQTSLHMETTENICALLRTFLQNLPEPILSPCLFEAVWSCCGVLVMVHEENGLAIDDVASMFGTIIFGGTFERIVSWTDSKPRPRVRISPAPPTLRSSPTNSTASSHPSALRTSGSPELASNYLDEVWPHLTSELRIKLNERMLDVMLEPLLAANSSKMTRQRSNSVPSSFKPLTTLHAPSSNDVVMRHQHSLANQRIAKLERLINDNYRILQDTINENQLITQAKFALEARVKELEAEVELRDGRYKEIEERVKKDLEGTVEGVIRERDQARGIVSEIQRLSGMVSGRRAAGGFIRG
ncbi:hypothetical protein AN958_02317 [Leucoagaricus sp. SymC.cos]|nr:hypothetical protein AN958_02317 [Leucoagaricus sp. SymC.cos]